jgi:hypothetical protein
VVTLIACAEQVGSRRKGKKVKMKSGMEKERREEEGWKWAFSFHPHGQ